jgi:hypothetical protein
VSAGEIVPVDGVIHGSKAILAESASADVTSRVDTLDPVSDASPLRGVRIPLPSKASSLAWDYQVSPWRRGRTRRAHFVAADLAHEDN